MGSMFFWMRGHAPGHSILEVLPILTQIPDVMKVETIASSFAHSDAIGSCICMKSTQLRLCFC